VLAPCLGYSEGKWVTVHRRRWSVLLLLACCPCASGLNPSLAINQYAHTAWTVREGFSRGYISSIAQTPDGYLWLGTEFGLLRFDGVRNVPWQPPGEHLPGDSIAGLLAARDGTLWIGTTEGLVSWKQGKLTGYQELAGNAVFGLLEDREGTVWAGGWALPTARLCAIRGGAAQCHGSDGSLGQWVESLYEDSRGNLWSGGMTGLWQWKPGPPHRYPMPSPVSSPQGLIEGDNGALLIALHGGISQFVGGKAEAYPLPGVGRQFTPRSLLRDRHGGLWIGTLDQGLLHVHQGKTDVFTQSDGLSGDFITALFEDREGSIWVATLDGLDRFRDFAVPTISLKQGLSSANVWSVLAARDGSVWLGTPGGLNRWNNGQIVTYREPGARARERGRLPTDADSTTAQQGLRRRSSGAPGPGTVREITDSGLPDDYLESLFEDDGGRIWVSTRRGAAYFENGRFHAVSGVPDGVHSIAGDSAGSLWISTEQALLHLIRGSVVERIPWAALGRKDWAATLLADPVRGGLWLGFFKSGMAYFKDGQVRASYAGADGLDEGGVTGLELDRDGTLWAATQHGLSRVKDGRIATLSSKNGLPCETVQWVAEDDRHSFWLYTACGLVRIARTELEAWAAHPERTIQATVFGVADGVRSHANASSYNPRVTKSTDGKLWFLPFDGVSIIDPSHLAFNQLPPPVHIEQVKANGKIYDASRGLRLPPLIRDLWIDYTALSLVEPRAVHFRYKLEGQDPEWKEVVNDRQAQYSNLAPRHYRFRVSACNSNGVWNEAGASLDFSIAPAYYQTNWFLASCAAAFLALLWALYRYRLHQAAQEFNMRLEERVNERMRIARDLHDTLLQSFQGLMLRFQVGVDRLPLSEAREALEKALEQGDKAIAEGRDSIHDLRSSTVITNDLTEAVRSLGDELASQDSATFHVTVEGSPRNLHPILRDEICRIAREAARNAFRHAQARRIEAEITYGERLFRLRIRDDGKGMDPGIAQEGRGGHYGLPGMRERARQIGGQLNIWTGPGAGTEIELTIPGPLAYGTPAARTWWHRLQSWKAKRNAEPRS